MASVGVALSEEALHKVSRAARDASGPEGQTLVLRVRPLQIFVQKFFGRISSIAGCRAISDG
jgi:hypothetical protein